MAVLEAPASGASVLIVDDEEGVRRYFNRRLTRAGYRCTTAPSGHEGLAFAESEDFDVALVDLCMPGMGGLEFLRALEDMGSETVPVVVTGYSDASSAVDAMKLGAFDFVEKPAALESLETVVARASEHRRLKRRALEMSVLAQQWEATFDAVPDLIAIVDREYRILRVNEALVQRLGIPRDAIEGRSCHSVLHGSDCPVVQCPHLCSLQDDAVHHASVHEPRLGGDFLITTSPLRDGQGRLVGSVHVARDVTAQKKAEDLLRKAHDETENLLASMSSLLIRVDESGKVTRWNPEAEKVFGISTAEALFRPFLELPIPWDSRYAAAHFQEWRTTPVPIRLPEMRCILPGDAGRFLDVTVNPVRTAAGETAGFFLMGNDVTSRKNLESQLVHAQKLESIGQLAAGIAHEINTPTQYVGDNTRFLESAFADLTDLLRVYGELADRASGNGLEPALMERLNGTVDRIDLAYLLTEIPKAIEESLHGVERVAHIVRAMKDFSHPSAAERTPVDLNRAIESTITVARNEWKYVAEMETDFDPELPMVLCLPGEFNQAILNIIINAAHAIGEVVGDGVGAKGKITVSTRCAGGFVEIRIGDTGCGIPERVRGRVFDPFFTTKEVGKGTGQGLAIAHNVIVEKHGGTLTFETEQGKGTTFVVRLPIGGADPSGGRGIL